jgi:hypothetical protein
MVRLGSDRPVWLIQPPAWVVQHLEPLPSPKFKIKMSPIAKIGVWMIQRSNPLASVNEAGRVIKITLP